MKHFLKYHDEIKKENLTETCEISNHTLNNRKQCALTFFKQLSKIHSHSYNKITNYYLQIHIKGKNPIN